MARRPLSRPWTAEETALVAKLLPRREELRSDCATAEAIILRRSASRSVGAVPAAAGVERAGS